jgi:hypothetical protein
MHLRLPRHETPPRHRSRPPSSPSPRPLRLEVIGLSMDTLKEERWQRDRDLFTAAAQAARRHRHRAVRQQQRHPSSSANIESLITQPGRCARHHPAQRRRDGQRPSNSPIRPVSPSSSYDRLITGCDLDYYLTFDNVKVGELQANVPRPIAPPDRQTAPHPHLRREDRQQRQALQAGPGQHPPAAHRRRQSRGRARRLGRGLEARERQEDHQRRHHQGRPEHRRHPRQQRRHRRRGHPGAHRGRPRRQGHRHRPGRRPRRLPAHRPARRP